MAEFTTVSLSIAERSYQLKCKTEEAECLKQAGGYLDMKMREIQTAGNAVGFERTAMMAAIDVCFEFMTLREQQSEYGEEMYGRLKNLSERVTHIIDDKNIELQSKTAGEQQALDI
jgi:cell division protein ZapA